VRTVHLVSCVSMKADRPKPARDLYESTWFKKARAYVETQGGPWFILSAEHGLLDPGDVVGPYDRTLNRMAILEWKAWAERTLIELRKRLLPTDRVVVLAGQRYRELMMEELLGYCAEVVVPMAGMRIGEQLQWLS